MFEIYSADWCGYCTKAKALLKERGIQYKEYDMDDDEVAESLQKRLPEPKRTIPQIWEGDQYVGGFDDLVKYLKVV